MVTLEQLRTQYRGQILALAEQQGVENIRVFGSVARGDQDEKSDVDLLYSQRPGYGLWEACGAQYRLEALLKIKVDFVCEDRLKSAYREHILREAVPL